MKVKTVQLFTKHHAQVYFEYKNQLRYANIALDYLSSVPEEEIFKKHNLSMNGLVPSILRALDLCVKYDINLPENNGVYGVYYIQLHQEVLLQHVSRLMLVIHSNFKWVNITDGQFDYCLIQALIKFLKDGLASRVAMRLGLDKYGIEGFIVRSVGRILQREHPNSSNYYYTSIGTILEHRQLWLDFFTKLQEGDKSKAFAKSCFVQLSVKHDTPCYLAFKELDGLLYAEVIPSKNYVPTIETMQLVDSQSTKALIAFFKNLQVQ